MNTLKVLSFILFSGQLSLTLFGQERLPVIDMHMHIGAPLDLPAGAPAPCLPQPCIRKGKATATPAENLKKTLEMMDRYNIVRGFLSDLDLNQLKEWAVAAPGRFITSPFILDPTKASPDHLRQELKAKRLAGVGEIGSQLMGIAPNDPRLDPYFAIPVLTLILH
jgi:uncharacterized protein